MWGSRRGFKTDWVTSVMSNMGSLSAEPVSFRLLNKRQLIAYWADEHI